MYRPSSGFFGTWEHVRYDIIAVGSAYGVHAQMTRSNWPLFSIGVSSSSLFGVAVALMPMSFSHSLMNCDVA